MALVAPYLAYGFFGSEIIDWRRKQMMGFVGKSAVLTLIINLTAGIAGLFQLVSLVAYGYDFGWKPAVGMLIFLFIIDFLSVLVMWSVVKILPGGAYIVLKTSFVPALYIAIIYITIHLSWFGFLRQQPY
jgi:hypothetical protein